MRLLSRMIDGPATAYSAQTMIVNVRWLVLEIARLHEPNISPMLRAANGSLHNHGLWHLTPYRKKNSCPLFRHQQFYFENSTATAVSDISVVPS
eukprot:m.211015 g.211015  ORF g.211015 m.211015 type:complete len:94 (+) comp19023_c0_seq9:1637-1918(+)